jgi:hypothetical protein
VPISGRCEVMQKLNEKEDIQITFQPEILKAVSRERDVNGRRT